MFYFLASASREQVSNIFFLILFPQEGEAFLDSEGGVKEDAKTRAQQKKLEELEEDSPSKMKRTTTMAATAQVR